MRKAEVNSTEAYITHDTIPTVNSKRVYTRIFKEIFSFWFEYLV
jgi:hypothetical protein